MNSLLAAALLVLLFYVKHSSTEGWEELTQDTEIPRSNEKANFKFRVMTTGRPDTEILIYDKKKVRDISIDIQYLDNEIYYISLCKDAEWEPVLGKLPSEEKRIWEYRITKTTTTVFCNFIKVIEHTCDEDYSSLDLHIPKSSNAIEKYNFDPETWNEVLKEKFVIFDLKQQPLRIKTEGNEFKGEINIDVHIGINMEGKIRLKMTSPPRLTLIPCISDDKEILISSDELSSNSSKPWNIIVNNSSFMIRWAGVEVFKYDFPDSCIWKYEDITAIKFSQSDTASKQYAVNECDVAPEGYYLNKTRSECFRCRDGQEPNNKKDGCVACEAGTYWSSKMLSCETCSDNYISTFHGSTECSECEEGTKSNPQHTQCMCSTGSVCGSVSNFCQSEAEDNKIYGSYLYLWPIAFVDKTMELSCEYNTEQRATKTCEITNEQYQYGPTDFTECKTKVTDELDIIEKDTITSTEEQVTMSKQIMEIADGNADVMNADNINKTSCIIIKILEFETDEGIPDEVVRNVLKTVDSVQKFTSASEFQSGNTASKMRDSVEKLSDIISAANKSDFITEQSVGVAVANPTDTHTSFSIVGDESDFTKTKKVPQEEASTEPAIFSLRVPVDTDRRSVTTIIYNTTKFYPDNQTAFEVDPVFVAQFKGTVTKNTMVNKIVSMVTDINYSNNYHNINFTNNENIELKYTIKNSPPIVYYKMHLRSQYECVYYNAVSKNWIRGQQSGCKTAVVMQHDKNVVTCQCNHMTSFAVLMSFSSDYDPVEEIVSQILLAISLTCLFCVTVAYLPAKDLLKTRTVRLNLLLVTSLILATVVFYFMEMTVITNIREGNTPTPTDTPSIQCVTVAFLMNYLWLCLMAWMVCEAVVMDRALVTSVVNSHISRYMLKFNLSCWGIPLVFPIIGLSWGKRDFANPETCFVRQKYGYVTFYGPVVICICFNICLFLHVTWSLSRKKNMTNNVPVNDWARRIKQFKFTVTVTTLLGIAWIFGFFLILQGTNVIWLRYLFIIFNSTQGISIFVLYVATNEDIKKVWKQKVWKQIIEMKVWKKFHGTSGSNNIRPQARPSQANNLGIELTNQTNLSNSQSQSNQGNCGTIISNPVAVTMLRHGHAPSPCPDRQESSTN